MYGMFNYCYTTCSICLIFLLITESRSKEKVRISFSVCVCACMIVTYITLRFRSQLHHLRYYRLNGIISEIRNRINYEALKLLHIQ